MILAVVLEYAEDREDIVKEFARILKNDGKISIVKHNRAGRVMQMVVLLNDFEHAHSLLDGKDVTEMKKLKKKMYKAVVFDFDYTLGDSTNGIVISVNYALNKIGYGGKYGIV